MKIIVGLGNPGDKYKITRHNIGFILLDKIAEDNGLTWQLNKKFNAEIAKLGDTFLVKPQTYMNLSGKTVASLSRTADVLPDDILVVFDDLDLPLGRLRLRPEGGSGGHKGMRSIIDSLGSRAFARLRVGIGRPPGKMDPADYVLQPFSEDEEPLVSVIVERAVAAVECWVVDGIVLAMDRFNRVLDSTDPATQEC